MTTTECRSERGNMTESERQRVTREWRERENSARKREKSYVLRHLTVSNTKI